MTTKKFEEFDSFENALEALSTGGPNVCFTVEIEVPLTEIRHLDDDDDIAGRIRQYGSLRFKGVRVEKANG